MRMAFELRSVEHSALFGALFDTRARQLIATRLPYCVGDGLLL